MKKHANCVMPFSFFFCFTNSIHWIFNLLITHTNVLRIVLVFSIFFQLFSIFHMLGTGVLRPLYYFFSSSFISSLVKQKRKKTPFPFHSAIPLGFNKKGHFLSAPMA